MPSQPRRTRARMTGAAVAGALLLVAAPALAVTPAAAVRESSTTAVPRSVDVPTDASARTKAKLETAEQELARLEMGAAQTKADYLAATARLSLALQTAFAAERRATAAQEQADRSARELGQFASNAYRAGPMAAAVAVLSSDSPSELLHTASMVAIVGANQSATLLELEHARTEATDARAAAQQGRDDASAAAAEASRLADLAHAQLTRAVELLTELREQARREARKARKERARRLAEAQRRLAAAQRTLASGPNAAPAAATAPGPQPGLPAAAGQDPGDGPPGPDHLRPRTERAKQLIMATFHVTDIGGWRPSDSVSDDHPNGKALDVMMVSGAPLPDPAHLDLGWRIARWAQANAAALGVTYVIWQARIWSVERAAEGWRDYTTNFPYGSSVNPTTLHLDHVHISFA